ncbi:MAG: PAS domain S-box protein, partial [Desulfobacula sp.]|nr:PAS domain S-box protein [Desulfobacula sp.]
MKFSNKLSFTIFITGLIALILLSFAIYKFNYDSVMVSQSKFTESIAIEVAEDINNILSEKIKIALTLANCNTIIQTLEENAASYANLPDEKRKASIKQLNEKWKSTKDPADNFILEFTDNKAAQFLKKQQTLLKDEYGEIFLTDKFGALVASTSKLSTFAHGHKYWWLGSYNNGKGAVFFDDRGYDASVGGYVLGLVVPVKKNDEIIGILKCNLNILGNITELITGPGNKLIGNSKLTRSGGRVVFEDGFEPLSTQIHHNIFEQLKNNDQGTIIINDSKEKYLVGFSQIKLTKGESGFGFGGTFESIDHKKGNKGESWYILCYRQMSVIQAPIIESIKSILLTGFAIIVALLLVSYLFGKKIAHPLAIINKATQKVGKGNFEYRIDISQKDEFGNLGRSFNQMADKLQHTTTSIELLENEIAERKQAEEALRESEEKSQQSLSRFKTIFEEAPLGIALIESLTGYIYEVNAKFAKIVRHTREEITTIDWIKITHPDDVQEDLDNMARLNAGEITGFQRDKRYLQPDGTVVWINMTVAPIQDSDKTHPHHLCMIEDITERKQLEDQLRQTQKMESIGNLAGGIAHDFNNLLSPIIGFAEILKEDLPQDSPEHECAQAILNAGERGGELVKQILAFSRQAEHKLQPIRVQKILKEVLKLTRSSIPTDIEIHHDIQQECGLVMAESTQLHQIAMNLITNAYHAVEKAGGRISIQLKETIVDAGVLQDSSLQLGQYAMLSVSDNGVGISRNVINRIFEPYFTTKEQGKGTGLGLAVAHGIVKEHLGEITVSSEEGNGTTFNCYLPLIKESAETIAN